LLGLFDAGNGPKLEGKRVDTSAEKDDIGTGKIGGDRRAAGGKRNRNIAGNQSLQRRWTAGDVEQFRIDIIFLENTRIFCDPERPIDQRDGSIGDSKRFGSGATRDQEKNERGKEPPNGR
jgi:hypothetical protein